MTDRPARATGDDPAPEDLATFSRTAVAGGHGGLLTVAGCRSRQIGYVDDDGEPVIVSAEPLDLGRSACLAVPAGDRRRVVLGGRLLPLGHRDQHVEGLLGVHAPCFVETVRSGSVRLARMCVDAVRVEGDRASVDVSCTDFAIAEPDLWAAFAPAVVEHLSECHGDVLPWIAAQQLPVEPVVAVAARRLRRTVLVLDVVTSLGASRVEAPIRVPVDDPREVCGRLPELIGDGPGWRATR